jgi:hypothetical protein
MSGTERSGVSWDDAADMCARRGMNLAKIGTEAEQAAVADAIAERMSYEIDTEGFVGSEFESVWLGGQRDTLRPYWHWLDGTEIWNGNFTNWAEGFKYSDKNDYEWHGIDKIAYLCMGAFSLQWRSCPAFTTSVYAYVCEERRETVAESYQRVYASPQVATVSPTSGIPGTKLTITGTGFNASSPMLKVTLGGEVCVILSATDMKIVCSMPQLDSGVVPVRVTTWLGQAGPSKLPLVTVQHIVYSLHPTSGSVGGGQVITVSGVNFPKDATKFYIELSAVVDSSVVKVPCRVLASNYSTIQCVTSKVSAVHRLDRYKRNEPYDLSMGLKYAGQLSVSTFLSGDGDKLRIVSQAAQSDFGHNQRPAIFLVSKDVGIEYAISGSDWLSFSFDTRLTAMFYDPFTRTVVASCGLSSITTTSSLCSISRSTIGTPPKDLVSFLTAGSSKYLLVVETHYFVYNQLNYNVYSAFAKCGGSDILSQGIQSNDYKQYIFVGQCGAGLSEGFSEGLGLEAKFTVPSMSIELMFDPFKHFNFTQSSLSSMATLSYNFDEDLTPFVDWISRKNGTTAGGTTVQLKGSGFKQNLTSVKLAGIVCATRQEEIGYYRGKFLCEWDGVDCSGLGVDTSGTTITCLSNKWDVDSGEDPFNRDVTVTVEGHGDALTGRTVNWSYMNLWSSKTTWGNDPLPVKGDSVLITYGEYIVLDISPPSLNLLTIQGNLEFARDVGDLYLNCSYIVLHYGRLFIGTEDDPFGPHNAVITLVGDRNSYEIPVYGAKCLAVRTAALYMFGMPRIPWTKLAETATVGNTTLVLKDETDWKAGDKIFVTSTEFNHLQAEELTVKATSQGGRIVEITTPLIYEHWGSGWSSGADSIDEYRASVGLLTRNVVVQGDDVYTQAQQVFDFAEQLFAPFKIVGSSHHLVFSYDRKFGAQIVLSTESNIGDNPLIGQFSNVEVRNAGQGLKLGKYPIHFHMVGNG